MAIVTKIEPCEDHWVGDPPPDCRKCKRFPMLSPLQFAYSKIELCHVCGCEMPNDLVCIDDSGNEYEAHADEPPGAGYSEAETPFADNE
jgi:hypothetical protein